MDGVEIDLMHWREVAGDGLGARVRWNVDEQHKECIQGLMGESETTINVVTLNE